jgi:hypothetical protein
MMPSAKAINNGSSEEHSPLRKKRMLRRNSYVHLQVGVCATQRPIDESTPWSQILETVVPVPLDGKMTPVHEFDFDFIAHVSDSRYNIFQWKHRPMQDS